MEKEIKITLQKKLSLYGMFGGSLEQPLCIIVHGLPGSMDEDFYYAAADWFVKRGFSTFRFNLYDHRKDARQLMDCTLQIHASDLDAVVRYFRKRGAKKIFVAGHSFGGLTILRSQDQDFDAVALWDPSYKVSFTKKAYGLPGGKYIRTLRGYLMRWGVNVILGKAMVKEVDALKWDSLTKDFKIPLKLILAGKGLLKGAKDYLKSAKGKKDLVVIKDATHYFSNQEGMREEVFRASEAWFKKFI